MKQVRFFFIILLCVSLIFIFSCSNDDSSSASDSITDSEGSLTDKEQSYIQSDHESSTEKVNTDDSDNTFTSSATDDIQESTESDEIILEYNNFSTIKETHKSDDRISQMAESNYTYNTGSKYTEEQLNEVLRKANLISSLGALAYKNATLFMSHFLDNTGEDYIIDVDEFLKDSNAQKNLNRDFTRAMRACEKLYHSDVGTIYQKEESLFHNLEGDWYYCVGSYFTSLKITNLTFDGNLYTATFEYTITDFYNWEESSFVNIFSGLARTIIGDISQKDLCQLHKAGLAKEFLSIGTYVTEVTWPEGEKYIFS